MKTHEQKLAEAIAYLNSRGKYVVDGSKRFRPTSAVDTDVAETMDDYRREVMHQARVREVRIGSK